MIRETATNRPPFYYSCFYIPLSRIEKLLGDPLAAGLGLDFHLPCVVKVVAVTDFVEKLNAVTIETCSWAASEGDGRPNRLLGSLLGSDW